MAHVYVHARHAGALSKIRPLKSSSVQRQAVHNGGAVSAAPLHTQSWSCHVPTVERNGFNAG